MAHTEVKKFLDDLWSWKAFLIGGASIIVCALTWALTPKTADLYTIGTFAFAMAFAINHPHFLSSYILLYGDFRKNIFKTFRYFWAAIIVPFALICAFTAALASNRPDWLSQIVAFMFLTVGWHYVKQIFGCMIVTNAKQSYYYSKFERHLILINLFSLWAISFLQSNVVVNQTYVFYGISYKSLELPAPLFGYAQWVFAISALGLLVLHVRKYVETGKLPSALAVVALMSLYVWYVPQMSHPFFGYLIPAFHSLQYLVFVGSFKTNKVADSVQHLKGAELRTAWLNKWVGFFIAAGVLGALFFEVIPKALDRQQLVSVTSGWSAETFLAIFLLFINIHHYFIDNVMWRSDNDEIKKFLFANASFDSKTKSNTQAA